MWISPYTNFIIVLFLQNDTTVILIFSSKHLFTRYVQTEHKNNNKVGVGISFTFDMHEGLFCVI